MTRSGLAGGKPCVVPSADLVSDAGVVFFPRRVLLLSSRRSRAREAEALGLVPSLPSSSSPPTSSSACQHLRLPASRQQSFDEGRNRFSSSQTFLNFPGSNRISFEYTALFNSTDRQRSRLSISARPVNMEFSTRLTTLAHFQGDKFNVQIDSFAFQDTRGLSPPLKSVRKMERGESERRSLR